jgi:hypothetical protein
MILRKLGIGCVAAGLLGIVLTLLADFLPGARPGIQSIQILGIEISIFILLIGIWAMLAASDESLVNGWQVRTFVDGILNRPVLVWVLVGFLVAYVLFLVVPMFLNSVLRMEYFSRYIPDRYPIGHDLITLLNSTRGWYLENQSPFQVNFYPPFSFIFFAPLLLVDHYPTLYTFFTLFNVLTYCFLTFSLPVKMTDNRNLPLVLLFFITGLTSYGFQFELERGQYNVLTFLLCLWAIYLFHYHPKYRLFAYLLFSISIQFKLYPAIFIVMLVDDWKAWKSILVRFAGIAAFNFLLLFSMGSQMFLDFLRAVAVQMSTPGWSWNGNHSIHAFVVNLAKDGYRIVGANTLEVIRQNSGTIETVLFVMFLILFGAALLIAYRRNQPGIDPYLLMACMIGALVIPISNDYTLSILAVPVALVLGSIPETKSAARKLVSIAMSLSISFCYASTLMPFKYKPYYLNNAFPPLFLILIFVTVLNLVRYKNSETPYLKEA